MIPALIAIAAEIGAPLVKKILERKIGAGNAQLATDVLAEVAKRAGVPVEQLDALATTDRARLGDAIQGVDTEVAPELIALYEAELKANADLVQAETDEPLWARAWRPIGMYWLYLLWTWNLIVLHVINAIWKIALPPVDLSVLLQLTTLYLGLYMGGHTVKAVMESWVRK